MSKSNYTPRPNREPITRESDPAGRWSSKFPDMIGYKSQGGGMVPADYGWNTNPKQWQEEMTPETLATEYRNLVIPRLPVTAAAPALPESAKPESK
ncbi:hypothetical protein JQX13_21775 [Archangium violaceum]|uniref:hypothetical protein n=1 Tax=Archangium violaceum TaxID=83451 RepID=UPI00193B6731|nr:hypothetical protein [Archangium violaceum]QRK12419.1 hypothetical protein JQX13_21775 [Archangium violaceum]